MIDAVKEKSLKNRCIVYDIETRSVDEHGNPVDIRDFDRYIKYAEPVFFGAYSYLDDRYYFYEVSNHKNEIVDLFERHDVVIGFNNEEFDNPIMIRNNLFPEPYDYGNFMVNHHYITIDCMTILGKSSFVMRNGYPMKNRGALMGYSFKNNSLRHMAEVMGLPEQKGSIDYTIFYKRLWSDEEIALIKRYLWGDVFVTKLLFEKLFDYWKSFGELLSEKNIDNFSWIRASIASLTYKAACHAMGVEETYAEKKSDAIREMGGRVLNPVVEEAHNCWIVDVASLYPHIMVMFNLFNEIPEEDVSKKKSEGRTIFHQNDVFVLKGYYDVTEQHILGKTIAERLVERIYLKKNDPTNPKIFALKIFMNGLYGTTSSEVFQKVYSPNIGWDTCYIGQQIIILAENMMKEYGFSTIYSDTDSLMLTADEEKYNNREYLQACLKKIVGTILANVPYPADTFSIDIEHKCPYMFFPHSEQPVKDADGNNIKVNNRLVKVRSGKKKNYLYIYEKKDGTMDIVVKGLPVIKDNATIIGQRIFTDIIKPLILKRKSALFTREELNHIISQVMTKKGVLELFAQEYKVKPYRTYKNPVQLQAQISQQYFDEGSGVILLIKNKKVGRVGKSLKYATIAEVTEAKLTADDFVMTKLFNELDVFVKQE